MIVRSKNFELKLEEITEENIINLAKNNTEFKALHLIDQWKKGIETFQFNTSGSTGAPKRITISRNKITYSAKATFQLIDPSNEINTTLLCISPEFIGGAMVVFRSLVMDLDLYIVEPTTDPAKINPDSKRINLVSMVPMQFESMQPHDIEKYDTILIGGAPVNRTFRSSNNQTKVFSTYGMTETVSHIALRKLDEPFFRTTGDIIVDLDMDGCLKFKGFLTDHKWMKTNDLGHTISTNEFEWAGRKDFIINSGGMKMNPEALEEKLAKQIERPFVISSIPDDQLGERLVLVIEGTDSEINFDYSSFSRYERPKQVTYWKKIPRTESNKIDRIAVKKRLSADEN